MPTVKPKTLPDGSKRYWFRVDVGRGPDGKRLQEYHSYERRAEAVAELARIMTESGRGTYVRQSDETLGDLLDTWLEGTTRDLRASTRRNYEDAFLPVRERLGGRRTQSIA